METSWLVGNVDALIGGICGSIVARARKGTAAWPLDLDVRVLAGGGGVLRWGHEPAWDLGMVPILLPTCLVRA
jgi:hypothetical protein